MMAVPFTAGFARSTDTSATFAIEVTARGPGGTSFVRGTMRVPGASRLKLFLLRLGCPSRSSGARVRGCSTLAPLYANSAASL